MPRGERQLPPSVHPHVNTLATKKAPYGLVLRDNVLKDGDLVVADGVTLVIKDHKTLACCLEFEVLHKKNGKAKKACGFLSQRLAQCVFFDLHFVLACHAHLDSVVPGGEQVFPFGCQSSTRVTEIFEGASKESEDWIVARLPSPS